MTGMPNESAFDWRKALEPLGKDYAGDERNVLIALRTCPDLAKLVRFNEFGLVVEFTRSPPWRKAEAGSRWGENDDTQLLAYLQGLGLKAKGVGTVANCIAVVAEDHAHHPVREFLERIIWDGTERLDSWTRDYLGADGHGGYLSAVGRRFLISAVARIMRPGCQADHVLVLEGAQGIGKTSAARTLAMNSNWFAGNLPDIHSKDAPIQLLGRWIVEISELRAVRNSKVEATKAFVTETVDTFRPPFGRRAGQFPRQCVFIATTNESEYLRDRTGNRRYWPITCQRIDIPALVRDREQLWAEAVHEFRLGTQWHLTADEGRLASVEQKTRVQVTELEHDVAAYLARLVEGGSREVCVRDVLVFGLGLDPNASTYAEQAKKHGTAVAEALESCGWVKVGRRNDSAALKDGQRPGDAKRTMYKLPAGQGGQGN